MENILAVSVILLITVATVAFVFKSFNSSFLNEEYKDVIIEVDKMPLLPKEAEMVNPSSPKELTTTDLNPIEAIKAPKKRTRKSKVDVQQ